MSTTIEARGGGAVGVSCGPTVGDACGVGPVRMTRLSVFRCGGTVTELMLTPAEVWRLAVAVAGHVGVMLPGELPDPCRLHPWLRRCD